MKITITTNMPPESPDTPEQHEEEKTEAPASVKHLKEYLPTQEKQQTQAPQPDVSLDPIELLKAGWQVFNTTWKLVLSLGVVLLLVSMAGQLAVESVADSWLAVPLDLLSTAVQLFVSAGLIYSLLRVSRGQQAEIKDLFSQGSVFISFFIANLAYGLLVVIGIFLLVIPGIYWALKYALVTYLVVDQKLGVGAAFSKSSQLTKGKLWKILVFSLVMGVFNVLGVLALGIGMLITIPVTSLAQVELYRRLLGETTEAK